MGLGEVSTLTHLVLPSVMLVQGLIVERLVDHQHLRRGEPGRTRAPELVIRDESQLTESRAFVQVDDEVPEVA